MKNTFEMLRLLRIENAHVRAKLQKLKKRHLSDMNQIMQHVKLIDELLNNSEMTTEEQAE